MTIRRGHWCLSHPGKWGGINDGGMTENPQGYALLFHPDLIRGTSLARKMKDYTFFSYEVNEALHMSERERQTIFNCFHEIEEEIQHTIDRHSRAIIVSNIEVLLNHCLRFYDRQFATREAVNSDVLTRFEALLNGYFDSKKPEELGLPSVAWCAEKLHLSANYFGDLVKKTDGQIGHRVHPFRHHQQGERPSVGDEQNRQRDCL